MIPATRASSAAQQRVDQQPHPAMTGEQQPPPSLGLLLPQLISTSLVTPETSIEGALVKLPAAGTQSPASTSTSTSLAAATSAAWVPIPTPIMSSLPQLAQSSLMRRGTSAAASAAAPALQPARVCSESSAELARILEQPLQPVAGAAQPSGHSCTGRQAGDNCSASSGSLLTPAPMGRVEDLLLQLQRIHKSVQQECSLKYAAALSATAASIAPAPIEHRESVDQRQSTSEASISGAFAATVGTQDSCAGNRQANLDFAVVEGAQLQPALTCASEVSHGNNKQASGDALARSAVEHCVTHGLQVPPESAVATVQTAVERAAILDCTPAHTAPASLPCAAIVCQDPASPSSASSKCTESCEPSVDGTSATAKKARTRRTRRGYLPIPTAGYHCVSTAEVTVDADDTGCCANEQQPPSGDCGGGWPVEADETADHTMWRMNGNKRKANSEHEWRSSYRPRRCSLRRGLVAGLILLPGVLVVLSALIDRSNFQLWPPRPLEIGRRNSSGLLFEILATPDAVARIVLSNGTGRAPSVSSESPVERSEMPRENANSTLTTAILEPVPSVMNGTLFADAALNMSIASFSITSLPATKQAAPRFQSLPPIQPPASPPPSASALPPGLPLPPGFPSPRPPSPPPLHPVPMVSIINLRFRLGRPSNDLASAGVLVSQFDILRDADLPWLPCQGTAWCARYGDRFPGSVVNSRFPGVYSRYLGGLILDPSSVRLFCSYFADGSTQGEEKRCEPPGVSAACVPGCYSYGQPIWCQSRAQYGGCAWRPEQLEQTMLQSEELSSKYNELVLDPDYWVQHLPHTVQAFFFLSTSGRKEEEQARQAHLAFLRTFKGSRTTTPLLVYHMDDRDEPFREVSNW